MERIHQGGHGGPTKRAHGGNSEQERSGPPLAVDTLGVGVTSVQALMAAGGNQGMVQMAQVQTKPKAPTVAGQFTVGKGPLQFTVKGGTEGGEAELTLNGSKSAPPIVLCPGVWIGLSIGAKGGLKGAISSGKISFELSNTQLEGKATVNGGVPGVFHVGGGGKASLGLNGGLSYDTRTRQWSFDTVIALKVALVVEAAFDALGAADFQGKSWGEWVKSLGDDKDGDDKTNAGLGFEYNPGGEVEVASYDLRTGTWKVFGNPLQKNIEWLEKNPPKPQPSHHPGSYEEWQKKQKRKKQGGTTPPPPSPGPYQPPG